MNHSKKYTYSQSDIDKAIEKYPIIRYFSYSHLPKHLQEISAGFHSTAMLMYMKTECSELIDTDGEIEAGFRKLLEAKDCFVRAAIRK